MSNSIEPDEWPEDSYTHTLRLHPHREIVQDAAASAMLIEMIESVFFSMSRN